MSKRRRRILMLVENHGYPSDIRAAFQAKALLEHGYEVSVICPTDKNRKWAENMDGVFVYRYPKPIELGGLVGYAWEFGYSLVMHAVWSVFVLCRRGFDCIHIHTPPDLMAMIAIAYRLIGKKYVFDLRDLSPELYLAQRGNETPNVIYKILRFFERIACRYADGLLATNETQRRVQIERGGAAGERCYLARYGPTERLLGNVKPKEDIREDGKLLLGFVGELGIQDGVEYMIRIVHQLREVHRREDFMAMIVGNGPAAAKLKSLARELGVEDSIRFTGAVPFADVPGYIAAFDICFTPDPSNSYNDSCTTIKTMEYMALRKPVVCFSTTENMVTAGAAALYAENNSVAQFAEQVIRLMDDPMLRQSIGEIGRQRIEDGLTWSHQVTNVLLLYEDLWKPLSRSVSAPSQAASKFK